MCNVQWLDVSRFAVILIITLATTEYRSVLSYITDLSNFCLISFIIHQYCWDFPILQIFLRIQSSLIPLLVLCFYFINISLVLAYKIWCNCFGSMHFLVSLCLSWHFWISLQRFCQFAKVWRCSLLPSTVFSGLTCSFPVQIT